MPKSQAGWLRAGVTMATHRHPGWDEVTLVEQQNEVLVWLLVLQVLLNLHRAGPHRVSCVQHLRVGGRRDGVCVCVCVLCVNVCVCVCVYVHVCVSVCVCVLALLQ